MTEKFTFVTESGVEMQDGYGKSLVRSSLHEAEKLKSAYAKRGIIVEIKRYGIGKFGDGGKYGGQKKRR